MPFVRKKTKAGRTMEIREYFTRQYPPPGTPRGRKEKATQVAQEVINRMAAERRLRLLINENFGPGDWHMTFTYRREERPKDRDEMDKDRRSLIAKIRRAYRKEGKELKYIYVAEIGERGAHHHHIVLNAEVDPKILQKIWKKGWVRFSLLDNSGQYRRLAAYLIKYSERNRKEPGALQKQRYIPSRNLRQPKEEIQIMKRKDFSKDPRVPKGYFLEKGSEREGVSALTGYRFREYTVIREGGG